MQAVITAEFLEGIPLPIRQRLNLRPGTVMDFDEEAPYLKAVPAAAGNAEVPMDQAAWNSAWDVLSRGWKQRMKDHPWEHMTSAAILDELRGPVELPPQTDHAHRD